MFNDMASFVAKWKPFSIFSNIKYIDQVFDDLTKCQRYDCQVVTSQTQYRDTDQHTEKCCCTQLPIRSARIKRSDPAHLCNILKTECT